jgi:IclR family transcriptional regulator, KDG regulon repressor
MLQIDSERFGKQKEPSSGVERNELSTSVGKAMALLAAFDRAAPIGVSELARKADLPKSTAFRLLAVLEQWQLVERVDTRYRLGTKLFELGNRVAYCCPHGLREVAHPFLEELHEATHEIVHLAVLVDYDVLYLEKVFGHNPVRSPSHVGGRVPAHCSAIGKAIMAFGEPEYVERLLASRLERRTPYTIVEARLLREELESIRKSGVAFDREGARLGLSCVAAPIRDRRGQAVAGLSISGATTRFDPGRYASYIRRVAASIGDRLVWAA